MKKFVSMLLVLSMVLALACTAMAAPKFEKESYAEFKCDANAYTKANAKSKTKNVVRKGSYAEVMCTKGSFVKLRVNTDKKIDRWFKASKLKPFSEEQEIPVKSWVIWAKGGKGMSYKTGKPVKDTEGILKGNIKVTGHTNLRKTPSLHLKSQGVVEKDKCLKLTGRFAMDDRGVIWLEVSVKSGKKCKKLWLSSMYADISDEELTELIWELEG